MKNIFALLILSTLFFSKMIIAQTTTADFRIPKECIGGKFYISKFDLITPVEAYQIISKDTTQEKDEILHNISTYNLIHFRKLNNYINESYEKCKDSTFILSYSRDIIENNKARFLISYVSGKSEILNEGTISEKFYIYDQKMKIAYKPFPSLESLIYTLKKTNDYFKNKSSNEITQEKINKYSEPSIPKEKKKKEMSVGAKITVQVLVYLILSILGAFLLSL